MMKALFTWQVNKELREYFQRGCKQAVEFIFPEDQNVDTLLELAPAASIIVGWTFNESLLEAAVNTRLLIVPAIGVDRQIPLVKKFPQITLVNSHGNAEPAAEMAVSLFLAAAKSIPLFDRKMRDGQWRDHNDSPVSELFSGVTAGVLGAGAVGQRIVKMLSGFPMSLLGCSRTGKRINDFPELKMYSSQDLRSFLHESRVLLISLPRTAATEGIIGEQELSCLPEKAILINVGRGSVVQEEPLYRALKEGRLHSAGLDVWYNYRPETVDGRQYPYRLPFHELDNVVLSPHRGASPLLRPGRFDDIIDNIRRFAEGRELINQVDLDQGY
jgi:phosphoglycerate dehydrogenase-like enzyme